MKIYEVGGAIRDELMGIVSKDVDYAVETASFQAMETWLKEQNFRLLVVKPEYFTIRALAPKGSPLGMKSPAVDFVLCRRDGPSADGRRPDYVEPGTILDDLARRDFTINAIARDMETGKLIDPHNGIDDIRSGVLRFVGDPMTRIQEDGLRVLRAVRFIVTKNLLGDENTLRAVYSRQAADMLKQVSIDRIREELEKMFEFDTVRSMHALNTMLPVPGRLAVFRDGLRLMPTTRQA